MRDLDARAAAQQGRVDTDVELTYLRADADPNWERPHRNGVDVTDMPEMWTPYQRARREAYEERVRQYRADGLI